MIKVFFPKTNSLSDEMSEEQAKQIQDMYITNNIYAWIIHTK